MIAGNYSYERRTVLTLINLQKSQGNKPHRCPRMDVDDLGSLFSTRIGESGNRRLEVYTALSNHLNLFFKYYLNRICDGDIEHQLKSVPGMKKEK